MGLKQFIGNQVDRLGTALGQKDRGLSEWITGGKQTTYTGITPSSQNKGFVRNYSGDMALNRNNPNPDIMRQVQKEQVRTIQKPQPTGPIGPRLPDGSFTGKMPKQPASIPTPSGLSDLGGSGGEADQAADAQRLADEQEAQRQADEEKRLIAEQEAKNESFRQHLGGQYGDIKSKFGDILGSFNEKLSSFPNALKQLNQQYKASIGEKEGQEIGQVGQKREQVAQQQKSGLSKIQEDVARNIRQGASRLGSLGMASSAAGMFQKAIQNAANNNAQNLLTQAANNYQQLDAEEARVKSSYKTMRDELDAEEANKTQDLQKNVNRIIADINERLQKSGEFERIDKEQLNTIHINELTNRFEEAKQASESYKQQLEQWRRENESRIRGLKDKMVQDFIPKEIQGRELAGINQRKQQQDTEVGLDPRRLRRLPEDNEEAAVPSNLQQITRRLRQDINQ
jgi:hypothetical protein